VANLNAANPAANPAASARDQFKLCMRERLRLAREVAGLRARFAAVVEDYERVIRTMQALGPSVGLTATEIRHPANPQWGPGALLMYADGHFLKAEQEGVDRLLHRLP
jgi:hypothetical protein